MGRLLVNAAAVLAGLGVIYAASVALTGTPLFGLLGGTGLQGALVPGPVAGLLAPEEPGRGGGGRSGPVPVEIARVTEGEVPVRLSFSGRFIATREAELRARVTGYLDERLFEEASFVTQGTTLFRLDQTPFRTRLDEAEAALDGARANLDYLEREVRRIEALEDQSFATESSLDELRAQRREAEARTRELSAAADRARLDLAFSTIEAPFDGKAGFARVDRGDLIQAGQTLLTSVVQYDPIEVEIQPSAGELARMRERLEGGGSIPVEIRREGDDTVFEGRISGLGPAFAVSTNTLPVRATVPNGERLLIPGQYARVGLRLGADTVRLVPTRALVTDQNARALYRVREDDTIEVVPVEAGAEHDGRTAVTGEIEPGDRVAVGNLQSLRPGMAVAPAEAGEGDRRRASTGGSGNGSGGGQ
ncbi:MAG: efflux RND transporter periplasmic adaptor subunit [Paracoccaceae bacterium]